MWGCVGRQQAKPWVGLGLKSHKKPWQQPPNPVRLNGLRSSIGPEPGQGQCCRYHTYQIMMSTVLYVRARLSVCVDLVHVSC